MDDSSFEVTWPSLIAEAAKAAGVALPQSTQRGMGSVLWRNPAGDRFVSFRPTMGKPTDPDRARVRWSFWRDERDRPQSVLVFHLPLRPDAETASRVVSVIHGWLSEGWEETVAKQRVATFTAVEMPPGTPEPADDEYWLCEDRGFGVVPSDGGWEILAGDTSLSVWKSKRDDSRGHLLMPEQLDRLCDWLARHWDAIAYGKHPRPPQLRTREPAACRAYESALRTATASDIDGLRAWWEEHAFRAADPELPNVFLERQGDDVIFSWDESPSETRAFIIPYGTAIASARFAVPTLRRLVGSRVGDPGTEPKVRTRALAVDPEAGFRALRSTSPGMTDQWLVRHRFSDEDARELALTGTARHPVVGLLRSAQGTTITHADLTNILARLRPNPGGGFRNLRALAKGMDAKIDPGEPWRSGYHLARLVRAESKGMETGRFDIEGAVREMSIDTIDTSFTDPTILAACVGSPQFAPLIAINDRCPDAAGTSGRRLTFAHEFCHLLFDRSRMQSFARFEGGAADSDRLIEMRANAFAVELLAPIRSFVKTDGTLMTDEEAENLSGQLEVSKVAIRRHVENHRRLPYELR